MGTPYYIGKGTGVRAFVNHGRISVPKDKSLIVFLDVFDNEEDAFRAERMFIQAFGRVDTQTGILHNLTDGGEGRVGAKFSEDTRKKMSISRTGDLNPMYGRRGELNPLYGKGGESHHMWGKKPMLGFKHSEETLERLRYIQSTRKRHPATIICCPHCSKQGGDNTMYRWHFDNCKERNHVNK
jgi:hypothetical protein